MLRAASLSRVDAGVVFPLQLARIPLSHELLEQLPGVGTGQIVEEGSTLIAQPRREFRVLLEVRIRADGLNLQAQADYSLACNPSKHAT